MNDTSPAAAQRYFELLRAKSPLERLRVAVRLTDAVRELALAGLKLEHPNATQKELRAGLAERLYGTEVARRFFGGS